MLATQGERVGLEVLVDSLETTGHLGYVYLTRVTGQDFGWGRDGKGLESWRKWLAGFTADEYRERVRRERLSPDVRRAGQQAFDAALKSLADGSPRSAVAEALRQLAGKLPSSDAAPEATELAKQLEAEAKEEALWKEPPSSEALSGDARTAWLVHHLRDARGIPLRFDGYTSVLPAKGKGAAPAKAPIVELLSRGPQAIPLLLSLLEDRRTIRATAWATRKVSQREWDSVHVVLRYQDAALEMLNALLPPPTYERKYTATYLSAEDFEARAESIAEVRSWAEDTAGKTPAEMEWVGIRRAPTREALETIRRVVADRKEVARALAELRAMFAGSRAEIWRPAICQLMIDLGDTSKAKELIEEFDAGKYSKQAAPYGEDSGAAFQAEEIATRIKEKYGGAAEATADPAMK
jgi:hypothetical protein